MRMVFPVEIRQPAALQVLVPLVPRIMPRQIPPAAELPVPVVQLAAPAVERAAELPEARVPQALRPAGNRCRTLA